ncbi:sirohydrochlorin chelatase [Parageobacillus thermoglucosidasius]|nr:sirohydrochlorin chelatase [Parageobacillus thermoglucosidasius]KYD17105.1 Sirohydrochlorin cobaltochelatase [Anoxybacillus flavithermus]REK54136.1 MAG: sirohydrochlorin chelatase [Geobacillus sp.]AEH48112.1 Sirohydrochlorin ferrochelatase [Parageobacillus thermoglucosidasius C56-YS93]EID44175.1 sirohydrochlorin cobaltochelatase [Parageobacillus thermoglucosidasius TNO-09.020]MBY6268884.1 sirohydrochlorin chelatase [Parageobacillus thermoglucosidasius]
MKAVLFVGHGSRDPEGNDQVRQFVEQLKPNIKASIHVETSFLEFGRPTIREGIDRCVSAGAREIIVIPMILLAAGHSKLHIPAEIDEAKKRYPHVAFIYGRPIGIHEQTFSILKTRLKEIGENIENPAPETAVVLLGRGGSDPDANSDLYKISRLFWEQTNYFLVEPAFMGVTAPSLDDAVERCVKLGARKVVVLPYFLFTGVLIKRLEKKVEQYGFQYPNVNFALAGYFGFHPELKTIMLDRLEEAIGKTVVMNCDMCQYRLHAAEHHHHHHHHHH